MSVNLFVHDCSELARVRFDLYEINKTKEPTLPYYLMAYGCVELKTIKMKLLGPKCLHQSKMQFHMRLKEALLATICLMHNTQ